MALHTRQPESSQFNLAMRTYHNITFYRTCVAYTSLLKYLYLQKCLVIRELVRQ